MRTLFFLVLLAPAPAVAGTITLDMNLPGLDAVSADDFSIGTLTDLSGVQEGDLVLVRPIDATSSPLRTALVTGATTSGTLTIASDGGQSTVLSLTGLRLTRITRVDREDATAREELGFTWATTSLVVTP